jgi:hypothetical protein
MPQTLLEHAVNRGSAALAKRVSRRAFVARVGLGSVALTLGEAGAMLLAPDVALADACPGCADCSDSVQCSLINGGVDSCPSGTCECGCWTVTDCNVCPGQPNCTKSWCDCCGGDFCIPAGGCQCSHGRPMCCYFKKWPGGCGQSSWHIACRHHRCGT